MYIVEDGLSDVKIRNSVDLMFVTTKKHQIKEINSAASYNKYVKHICEDFFQATIYSYDSIDGYCKKLEDIECAYYIPILFIVGVDIEGYQDIKQVIEKQQKDKNTITICINCEKDRSEYIANENVTNFCTINIKHISNINFININSILREIICGGHRIDSWTFEEQCISIKNYIKEINNKIANGISREEKTNNCLSESVLETIRKDMENLLKSLEE